MHNKLRRDITAMLNGGLHTGQVPMESGVGPLLNRALNALGGPVADNRPFAEIPVITIAEAQPGTVIIRGRRLVRSGSETITCQCKEHGDFQPGDPLTEEGEACVKRLTATTTTPCP